jgi:23S rRNA (cytidine1920-2'-O)/16S rRNA (cytidine1409-2'-O)-methyltransferase
VSPRVRLDTLVVERDLAETRTRARALILAGQIRVNGEVVAKAGAPTTTNSVVTLTSPDHPYVGRGGVKLAHALDIFGIDPRKRIALDIGASTGGFTDVLLQRGAERVVALDVGHNQLAWKIRQNPQVVVLEGLNARILQANMLPVDCHQFDIVTIDVAFISATLIIDRVPPLLTSGADVVALIKPQFEAGRNEVGRKGVVTDPAVHQRVINKVATAADRIGLKQVGMTRSPITGAEGNHEFFLHLRI